MIDRASFRGTIVVGAVELLGKVVAKEKEEAEIELRNGF